ncbi:MAG: bifunctional phosphoserine phosphatase/homoserine phosphotransferase ThrH [Verrucomicrobiae bacterium]
MVLLFGGTSDGAPIAEALARAGYRVLVSSATDVPLFSGAHPRIERRSGRLDASQMAELVTGRRIRAIVDATHPYALAVRATASDVAIKLGIPYLSYLRPGSMSGTDGVCVAADHQEAARRSVEPGRTVLLTIGSRNVLPYALEARRAGLDLIVRVLDHPDSHQSCRDAGIPAHHIVTGRGPFRVEENRALIRQFGAGVLVTKDSGDAGGVREKIEAARLEGCEVVVVGRPQAPAQGQFDEIPGLVEKLKTLVHVPPCSVLALDLESVLVPEIWETVAQVARVPEFALTTRDIADYGALMRQRISLCRQHGLTLMRLREIVASIEPLPGAIAFLAWARQRALVAILSDTFHELAGPVMSKLGSPLMICHSLTLDAAGFITGYTLRDGGGKAGAVADFQRLGWRVAAAGDSFNDLEMLQAADAAFLFLPPQHVLEAGVAFPALWSFDELQSHLAPSLL